jgi:hypothetical protein
VRQLRYYHTEGASTLILFSSCGEWRRRRLGNTQRRINVLMGDDGGGASTAVAGAADSLLLLLRLRPRRLTDSCMARCGGLPIWRNKNTKLMHMCMYVTVKYSQIHADMPSDTVRYIQMCTSCKNAYMPVFRVKIQSHTYKYALPSGMHMCMYLHVYRLNIPDIQAHMHWIQLI